jgi:hypothetical protein
MKTPDLPLILAPRIEKWLILGLSFLASLPLTGCIVVGASSSGGWFIWPGSVGLLFLGLLLVVLLRRGR